MWRKPEYPVKTTDLARVTDKLHHIVLSNASRNERDPFIVKIYEDPNVF
jgi:hypothetical protein